MAQMKFAIMLWPTDKNFISVHSLDHIRQPRKPFNDYRFGEECLTVYPACKFPGPDGFSEQGESLWKTVILGIGDARPKLQELTNKIKKDVNVIIQNGMSDEEITSLIVNHVKQSDESQVPVNIPPSKEQKTATTPVPAKTDTAKMVTQSRKKTVTKTRKDNNKTQTDKDGQNKTKKKTTTSTPQIRKDTEATSRQKKDSEAITCPRQKKDTEVTSRQNKDDEATSGQKKDSEVPSGQKKGAETNSRQKKITKALEAIAEEELLKDLQSELQGTELTALEEIEKDMCLENTVLENPAQQPLHEKQHSAKEPLQQNISDAIRSSNMVLYDGYPTNRSFLEKDTCIGCVQLTQKIQGMEENMNWMWHQIQQLQKQMPGISSSCCHTQSTPIHFQSPRPASSTVTSEMLQMTVIPDQSPVPTTQSPLPTTQSPVPTTQSPVPTTQTTNGKIELGEETPISTDQESSKNPCVTNPKCPDLDNSVIYNGYTVTVGQLRKHAKRQRSFSRAAKTLMDMMFTEDEKRGRCLTTYIRFKKDGQKIQKEGLEDQAKLSVLQDIVQAEYEEGTPRKVRKKLADKLKPSASADYVKKTGNTNAESDTE